MRRATIAIGLVVVIGAGATAAAWSIGLLGGAPAATTATEPEPRATATVTRRTLELVEELDGTLGFEGGGSIVNQLSGTVTAVPAEGEILERGDTILEVDGGRVSALMYGERPAWRTLQVGVDDGPDVRQLQENLQALGYFEADLEPDEVFGQYTEAAVIAWQAARGVEDDGIVRLGDVVFLPGAVRLTTVTAQLGTRVNAGQSIATTSSTTRVITVSLNANRQDILAVGDAVTVELPDGTTTPGRIDAIASVATPPTQQGGSAQVEVTVRLDDPATSGSQDGAPVTVAIVRDRRENVLTVPVTALIALAEGGYAVEAVDADGAVRLVAVTPGLFSGTVVEVRSDELAEGQSVAVPA
jgi:peptidoglycan hydrolase-like protein with peptidoglycan-binding domain